MKEQKISQSPYIFHTSRSPFSRGITINRGENNAVADWNRSLTRIVIDGCLLQDLVKEYNTKYKSNNENAHFTSLDDLREFLKLYLFKNIPVEKQEKVLDEAMRILHQGGVLNPFSAAASEVMASKSIIADNNSRESRTNFITTANGFTVQEIVTQRHLFLVDQEESADPEPKEIYPDPGKEYVYQGQATIDVDFSGEQASCRVINSTVSYGSSLLESKLDERSFLQKIHDFFKRLFGRPSVEVVEDLGAPGLGRNS